MRGALSERARHDRVHVVSGFVASAPPKTKDAVSVLSALTGTPRGVGALVVAHRDDELTWLSLRNVAGVHVLAVDQLNTYDVLASDHVVFTEEALTAFLGTGQGQGAAGATARDEAVQDDAGQEGTAPDDAAARDEAAQVDDARDEAPSAGSEPDEAGEPDEDSEEEQP